MRVMCQTLSLIWWGFLFFLNKNVTKLVFLCIIKYISNSYKQYK